jgi:hypothetical protein
LSSFLLLANASTAGRAAVSASDQAGIASLVTPMWVLVIGVLVALLIMIGILVSVRNLLTAKPKAGTDKGDFTRMLCERIWVHTDTALGKFARGLRDHPASMPALQMQVRNLREDLSEAVLYIDYMKAYPANAWPSARLFGAYSVWAGQVAAMESQLADLFAQISRPVAQEPVDKDREKRMLQYYETEQRILNRGVDKLHGHAFRLCEAAREFLKKDGGNGFGFAGAKDHGDGHHSCPCCSRMPDKHVQPRLDDLPVTMVNIEAAPKPPAPAPPPPPPPAPQFVSAAPVYTLQPLPKPDEKKADH